MSNNINLEQLQKLFETTGVTDVASQKKMAKDLGLTLPEPPPAELSEQLLGVKVVRGHVGKVTKRNPEPRPKDYISVPALKLEGDGARGFWVNAAVARSVALKILEVCDKEGIK